jgi:hypothetical protein
MGYDKDQPRHPAGTDQGGEWSSDSGGKGGGGGSKPGPQSDPGGAGWFGPARANEVSQHKALLNNAVPLNGEQQQAVHEYQTTGEYFNVATHLRGVGMETFDGTRVNPPTSREKGRLSKTKQSVTRLDSAIAAQKPLEKDIVLHRGFELGVIDESFSTSYERGATEAHVKSFLSQIDTIQDKSFISTSTSAGTAAEFSPTAAIVLRIRVPKGAKVLPLPSTTEYTEQEVLLGRGTKIRMTGYEPGDDMVFAEGRVRTRNWIINAEVVQ